MSGRTPHTFPLVPRFFFLSINLLFSQETVRCFLLSCPNSIPSSSLFPISTHQDFFLARPISIQCISLTKFEISTHPKAFGLPIQWECISFTILDQPIRSHDSNRPIRSDLLFPVHSLFPDCDVIWGVSAVLVHLYNYCHIHTVISQKRKYSYSIVTHWITFPKTVLKL